ncbi:hypothetical protein B0H21DRAFT_890852 [Amylocystis lapponica]|nr:hypothetical protein B0H21DRAFT_890852 [Amylocystis lapponica]
MLWRVCQGYRQLHQAAFLLLTSHRPFTHPSLLLVQPLHQSIVAQWPSAAAQVRLSYDSTPARHSVIREVSRPRRKMKASGVSLMGAEKLPDPAFSAMVDALFCHGTMKRGALRKLQASGNSSPFLDHLGDRVKAATLATLMVNTTRPRRALEILIVARELGCNLKQSAYECVAHALAERQYWTLVPPLVELGKQHTGRTTIRLLNWCARALLETQQFSQFDHLPERFIVEGLRPNRRTFHLLISGHLRNRDLFKAKQYLAEMEAAGFPIDTSTHALIVSVYRSLGSDPVVKAKAVEVLQGADDRFSTVILNSLMQLSLDTNDMPGALQLLSQSTRPVTDSGRAPNPGGDITLGGGDGALPVEPGDTYGPPRTDNPLPIPAPLYDAATFTMLINHLARDGDLTRALGVLQRMKAMNVIPDSSTAAALVRVHFRAGHPEAAVRIVADICEAHRVPRFLFSYVGLGSLEPSSPTLLPPGLIPTTDLFNALLEGVLRMHGLNGMRIVRRIMQTSNVRVDEFTLDTFLSYLEKDGQARPRQLMSLLRTLPFREAPLTLRHLHVIMKSVLRQEKNLLRVRNRKLSASDFITRRVEPLLSAGRLSGVAESLDPTAGICFPRAHSYRSLMRPILKRLAVRRVRSDRATFALRINHDAVVKGDLKMAEDSFQAMVARGMHPNEYHFSAMMEGYAEAGDLRAAAEIMESAVKMGVARNVTMYTILIMGHARQRNPTQAVRVFHDMLAAGVKPDVMAILALMRAFIIAQKYISARRVLLQLWPSIGPFPLELHRVPLKQLAAEFKALGKRNQGVPGPFSKQTQRMLRWKLRRIASSWKYPKAYFEETRPHHVSRRATPNANSISR